MKSCETQFIVGDIVQIKEYSEILEDSGIEENFKDWVRTHVDENLKVVVVTPITRADSTIEKYIYELSTLDGKSYSGEAFYVNELKLIGKDTGWDF